MATTDRVKRGLHGAQRLILWGGAVAMMLAPAVAMQFTNEVAWGRGDFATLALMLILGAGAFELAALRTRRPILLCLAGVAIGLALLLVWAQLAVGVW